MKKKKLKSIMPSLRERKRYLAFEFISESKTKDYDTVFSSIRTYYGRLSGAIGVSEAGLIGLPKTWDHELQRGLFRVSAKKAEELKAALALVKEVNGKRAMIRSLGASGILKKAKQYLIAG